MSILSKKTTIINIIRIIVAQYSFRREEKRIKSNPQIYFY